MEAVNGVSDADKGIPTAPSPLTGCYLLIVVGEPHSQEHKDIILRRIAKGLLSWDASDCYVDLEKELAIITEQAPEGEDARYGERLIQFASENLVTEILIHPAISTLSQCMKNLLSSFTRHRHIIHSGYTYAANGSWILQDGTFSLADFSEAFQEIEVQRILRAYDNSISLDIHCSPEGDWTRLPKESFTKNCKVRVNPDDVLSSGSSSISSFLSYVSPFLIPTDIETLLESSDVVGNIRFSHPTLYVFPGGQGDAALFGINGFNMLVDGGFARKSCFWDFVRHLDRLDAVLLTRLNNSNINGISSILRRKKFNTVYPQIGHFFCNIQERKSLLSPDGDKDKDPLLINLLEEGQELFNNLRQLNLQPQPCYRDVEPINLYHKVGHGTLDMYVISPSRDSKEVREFLQKWNSNDQKLFSNQRIGKDLAFPIQNLISICALLVWQPANANHNITRILFPGSTPQHKIFEGLDKLKQLECMKYPSCTAKTIAPVGMKSKYQKSEKLLQDHKEFKIRDKHIQNDSKNKIENKMTEEIIKNGHTIGISTDHIIPTRTIRKHDSTESEKSGPKSTENKKADDKKDVVDKAGEEKGKGRGKIDPKLKADPKALKKSRSIERKPKPAVDKKPSPTTPKKTIDTKLNGDAHRFRAKTSPSSTPAKSTKEANNRKVVESKYKVAAKRDVSKPEKKEVKDRKPISRKTAESSPSRKVFESPIRKPSELHKVESRKAKIEKEGTTDSSTVSTPSAADADISMKKELSKLTPEELEQFKARELAELKEEQEVVNEIEAVFRKSESKKSGDSDLRKIKSISVDDKTEGEEYLIIEKEVIDQDSLDEKDTKDGENQKHLRDSEESEKQRKLSNDAPIEKLQLGEKSDENIVHSTDKTPPTADIANVAQSKEFSKDVSATSPEEKLDGSGGKKICDRDMDEENRENNILESQPDEKYSTPIESGATTAPTLPEDERIPLDEIKEDNADQIIVEKYVKEDTKEKDIPAVQVPSVSAECKSKLPHIVGIRLDKQTPIRDIVKTPDEVADLPMHEVVDSDNYEQYQTSNDTNKQDENKHLNITKAIIRPKELKEFSNGLPEKVPQDETEVVDEKEEVPAEDKLPIDKQDTKPEEPSRDQEELEIEKKELVTETLEENLIQTSVEESEKDNDNEKGIIEKEKLEDLNLPINEESNLQKDDQIKESVTKTIPVDTDEQTHDIDDEGKLTIELSQDAHVEATVTEKPTTEKDGKKELIESTVEITKTEPEKDETVKSILESSKETPVETDLIETKETILDSSIDDKKIETISQEKPTDDNKIGLSILEPAKEIDTQEEKEDTEKQVDDSEIKKEEPTDKHVDEQRNLVAALIVEASTEVKTEETVKKIVEHTGELTTTEDVIESKTAKEVIKQEEKTTEVISEKVAEKVVSGVEELTTDKNEIVEEKIEIVPNKIEETTKKEIHQKITEGTVEPIEDTISKKHEEDILKEGDKIEDSTKQPLILDEDQEIIKAFDKETKLISDETTAIISSKEVPQDLAKVVLDSDKEPQLIEKVEEKLLESTKETKDSTVEVTETEIHTEKITTEITTQIVEDDNKAQSHETKESVEDIPSKLISKEMEETQSEIPLIEIKKADIKETEGSTESLAEIEKELKTEIEKEVKTEIEKELKTEVEKESKTAVDKDLKTEVEKEVKPEIEKESKTEIEKESKPEIEKESRTEIEKDSKTEIEKESKTELEKESKTEIEKDSKTEIEKAKSEVEKESKTEIEKESKTELGKDSKTETEKDLKTETEKDSKTEIEKEVPVSKIEEESKENEKDIVHDKPVHSTETKDSEISEKTTKETLESTTIDSEKIVTKTEEKIIDQEIVQSITKTNAIEETSATSVSNLKDEAEEKVLKIDDDKLDAEKLLATHDDKIKESEIDSKLTSAEDKKIEEKCVDISSEDKESGLSIGKQQDSEIVDLNASDSKDITAPKIDGTKADLDNLEKPSATTGTEKIDIKTTEKEVKDSEGTTNVIKVTEVISHEITSELNAISEIDEQIHIDSENETIISGTIKDGLHKIETKEDQEKIETKEIDSSKASHEVESKIINDGKIKDGDIHVEDKIEILIPKEIKSDKRKSIHEEVEIVKPEAVVDRHEKISETTQSIETVLKTDLDKETLVGLIQLEDIKDDHTIVIPEEKLEVNNTISALKTSETEKVEIPIDEQIIKKEDTKLDENELMETEKLKISSDAPSEDLQTKTLKSELSEKDEKETSKLTEKLIHEIVEETELNLNKIVKELDKTDKIDLQKDEDSLSKNKLTKEIIESEENIDEESRDKHINKEDIIQQIQGDLDNKIEKLSEPELQTVETVLDKINVKATESDKHELINLSEQLEDDLELPKGELNLQERSDSVCTVKSVEDETIFKSDNLTKNEIDLLDKMELGRKSPKEREQDVAIIVASVAEVLKSDAPLEEFEGKIPLEVTTFSSYPLRETHITTVDSPICDKDISSTFKSYEVSDPVSTFLIEERKIAPIHTNYDTPTTQESKVSSLIKDSADLIEASSKIISGIKQTSNGNDIHVVEDVMEPSLPSVIEKPLEETTVSKQESALGISQVIEPVHTEDEHKKKEEVHDKVLSDIKIDDSTNEKNKESKVIEDLLLKEELTSSIIISKTQDVVDLSKELTIELEKDVDIKQEVLDSTVKSSSSSRKSTPEPIIKDTLEVNGSSLSGKSTPDIKDTTPSNKSPIPSRASTPSIVINEDKSDIDGKLIEPYIESEIEITKDLKCTDDSTKISKDEEKIDIDIKSSDKIESDLNKKEDTSSTPKDVIVKEKLTENVFDITKSFIDNEKSSHCDKIKDDLQIAQQSIELGECIENNLKDTSGDLKGNEISSKSIPQELETHRSSISDITETEKSDKLKDFSTGKTTPPAEQTTPIVKTPPQILDDHDTIDKKESKDVLNLKTSEIRSSTPTSDDCDISSGQVSRAHTTEDDYEKELSDEDLPGSPLSAMSQVAHSTSSQYDIEDSIKSAPPIDPMSTSFYGALPDDSVELSKEKKTSHTLEDTDLDFNKALIEHRQTRGEDLVPSGSPSHVYEITTAKYSSGKLKEIPESSKSEVVTAPTENLMTASFIGSQLPSDSKEDPIASWGKPLGLPSPAPINDNKGTPKKERKIVSNVIAKNKLNEDKKNADSKYDKKGKKIIPVYMDLTYVPHHGNSNYSYVDFFKKVRARYYVFSGIEPSKEVYNALLEAKQTWDDKELEVTIISTYDTDVLGYWVAENEDLLTKCKIDLSPSASRCTINLQDHETSCSAYRLEFS